MNSRTYLLKLHRSGGGTGATSKATLLLESGVRFHVTRYEREKRRMPSGFAAKLRKHVRNARVTAIRQVGSDRVVDFQFGDGDKAMHIILEL